MSSTLIEAIADLPFPVYGIAKDPLGLIMEGHLAFGGIFPNITLSYKSPRYPLYPNVTLGVTTFWMTSMSSSLGTPSKDGQLDAILKEQAQPVPEPFCWAGEMRIADTPFRGTIIYYSPSTIAAFALRSESTLLRGKSYGPSYDELIELLEGLQVLNGRDDVLRQYDKPRDL